MRGSRIGSTRKRHAQVCVDGVEEFFGVQVVFAVVHLVAVNAHGKVLRHPATFDHIDADLLKGLTERDQFLVAIELAAEFKSTCPRKDRRNRIR